MQYADQPILNPEQDRLSRTPFAKFLARAIKQMPNAADGFVIGLIGEWGSGKSSIVELVLQNIKQMEILDDMNRRRALDRAWNENDVDDLRRLYSRVEPCVSKLNSRNLDVSLWWSVDRDHTFRKFYSDSREGELVSEYFDSLCEVEKSRKNLVVRFSPWMIPTETELASTLLVEVTRSIGQTLGNEIAKDFADLFVSVAELSKFLGVAADLALPTFGLGKISSSAMSVLEANFKRLAREPSLDRTRNRLIKSLKKLSGRKILVIIDDLDRLSPSEAARIVTAVKGLVGLPNVVYLLAYDDKQLSNLLEEYFGVDGAGFLEKIVQYPVHVPFAKGPAILNLLDQGLGELIQNASPDASSRLSDIWQNVLRYYLRTPRDVNRLLNGFSMAQTALGDQTDPIDLLLIEFLRVKTPIAYDYIRENISDLLGETFA